MKAVMRLVSLFFVGVVVLLAMACVQASRQAGRSIQYDTLQMFQSQSEDVMVLLETNAVMMLEADSFSHAVDRHPADAPLVRSACQNPKFMIPVTRRSYIDVCQLLDGRWGFRFMREKGKGIGGTPQYYEITAYVRETLISVDDLVKFCTERNLVLFLYVSGNALERVLH